MEQEEELNDEEKADEGKAFLPRERPFSTEQLVRRAYEGLGHPGNERLARILQTANASKKVIDYAKNLVCATCQQHELARPLEQLRHQKNYHPTIPLELPTPGKKRRMALNIVRWSTRFQMVIPLRSHTAPDTRGASLEWVRFMGVPKGLLGKNSVRRSKMEQN